MINEYNHCIPRATTPPEDGIAFSQKSTKRSNSDHKNYDWNKIATCHKCGKKGHIILNWPNTKSDEDDGNESTYKEK